MTFTHTDIHQRLIDFLYGELDGEARVAFAAHLGTCDACRAEVRAFEQTRAAARAVVRAPLEGSIPAAVRARVMDAAARATTSPKVTGAAAAPAAAAAAPPASSPWFAWLRARWAVPMLATAAALGGLLLVRETIFREARRPLGERPPADLAPQGAPRPDRETSSGETVTATKPKVSAARHRRSAAPAPAMPQAPSVSAAKSPPPARSLARRSAGDSLEGPSSSSPPAAAASEASPSFARQGEAQPAGEPSERSAMRAEDTRPAAGAPASAAAPASAPAPDPAAAQADRAEKLMAARRWGQAVVAYRALIQGFPGHPSVAVWRRRLAAAEAAAARDDERFGR